jgi:hypothetical protein
MPNLEYHDEKERELVETYITALRGLVAASMEYRPTDPRIEIGGHKANNAWANLVLYYRDKYTCQSPPVAK